MCGCYGLKPNLGGDPMKSHRIAILAAAISSVFAAAASVHADGPKVLLFRAQTVNQKTYFHVRIERPADLASDMPNRLRSPGVSAATDPLLRPRLAAQDDAARLVYLREAGMEPVVQAVLP